jgi:hypothetical protein
MMSVTAAKMKIVKQISLGQ